MEQAIARLASALRLAERAHAQYELTKPEHEQEWPEFYAQFLLDNAHLWANVHTNCEDGKCEWHEHG